MDFKDILKELLLEYDLTARKLCEILDIDHSSICRYMQGCYPNITNAVKLANYFNCSLNFMCGIDELPNEYQFFSTYDEAAFFVRYIKLLKLNKISHYKVSKELKFGNSAFQKWKSGSLPKLETLIKLSNFFGYSIDYFIGRSNS